MSVQPAWPLHLSFALSLTFSHSLSLIHLVALTLSRLVESNGILTTIAS